MMPHFGRFLLILCGSVGASRIQPPLPSTSSTKCAITYGSDVLCGVPKPQPGFRQHPKEALVGEYPWHVSIIHKYYSAPVYNCGGSLINDRFVLTAARCVVLESIGHRMEAELLEVWLGYHDYEVEQDAGCSERVGVRRNLHPERDPQRAKHDLALLELDRKVRLNDRILPVCIDADEKDPPNFYDMQGQLPGWGHTEFDATSTKLRTKDLPLVNNTECLQSSHTLFANYLYDGIFCAGFANGTNVCNGDFGGGLVTNRNGRWKLMGILTFTGIQEGRAQKCATDQYAAFVKVRHYREWIAGHLFSSAPTTSSEM